jgi:signal transduction histidine kinase
MRNADQMLSRARQGAAWRPQDRLDIDGKRPAVVLLSGIAAAELMLLVEPAAQTGWLPLQAILAGLVAGVAADLAIAKRSLEKTLEAERARAVHALDFERQRIQRDLHDSVQQRLVSVRIRMGMLAQRNRRERTPLTALARDVEEALSEIRSVTLHGSPDLLRRVGVPAALRSAAVSSTVPVSIEAPGFGRFTPLMEQNLYFTCLEAIQNVIKHAGARQAWIRLRSERTRVMFEIEDVGRGFDPSNVTPGEGLRNMADRIALLGGSLSIDTTPEQGTLIRGEIPTR